MLSAAVFSLWLWTMVLPRPGSADESQAQDVATGGGKDSGGAAGLPESLPPRYVRWLEEVALLISDVEREVFLGLEENYQRDHFVRRFWKARDPFRRTAVNELHEVWEARVRSARETFGRLDNEGAEMVLRLGEPDRRQRLSCSDVMPSIEVWYYPEGAEQVTGQYFTLVFTGHRSEDRLVNYRMWNPTFGLRSLLHAGYASRVGAGDDRALVNLIAHECIRGDDIVSALLSSLDTSILDRLLPKPPSDEWVRSFEARSTSLGEDAEPLEAELSLSFPGRHQSRTVVQGFIAVPRNGATAAGENRKFYNLLLDGEVLRQNKLFDSFRYRFDFPAEETGELLPVVLQRYLRPGRYQLIVKVEDIHSKRAFRQELDLEVPIYDPAVHAPRPPQVAEAPPGGEPTTTAETVTAEAATAQAAPLEIQVPRLLDEANQTISAGDTTIRILPLPKTLTIGKVRVRARTSGKDIARVAFELNGVPQMKKSRPPYSVEIDLGEKPRIHTLRVVALDAAGKPLAADEVEVNAGPQRFSVRLIEPQQGKRYGSSLRVHAEVEIPELDQLDRVELYVNETRLTTLYQEPFEHPLLLHNPKDFTYVRAVAYLAGGNTSEDTVIINTPNSDFVDDLRVNFKELYTTMITKKGDFVEDVTEAEITVLEDDIEQQIRRFDKVRDLPIIAGLVLDTSTSMMPVLRDVRRAAHRFLETVLAPRDRAALMTFNDAPQLVVPFTSDTEVLAGGLTGLVAEGETALYDTVIFALHYLSGGNGKRALVLLTDGEDSSSTYSFDDAIEFARYTGVSIYIIGLGLSTELQSRSHVRQLAAETGGGSFFIDRVEQLGKVYESIQQELRSQYLIGYQSSQSGKPAGEFRKVEVLVDRKGVEAKTIRGYYP